jgi:hydroxyacylglutathione hydrolase
LTRPIEKSAGTRGIFRSLHDQLLSLPDQCEVWPGHLGGSMCGGPTMDMKISTTIGYERANNLTLGITDEDQFVAVALAPGRPPATELPGDRRPQPGAAPDRRRRASSARAAQVEQQRVNGALVVDVRTDLQFDEAHVPGLSASR